MDQLLSALQQSNDCLYNNSITIQFSVKNLWAFRHAQIHEQRNVDMVSGIVRADHHKCVAKQFLQKYHNTGTEI